MTMFFPFDSRTWWRITTTLRFRPEYECRGDTYQIMMISGVGQDRGADPIRSKEILTGAMPAAKKGLRSIETTWKGARVRRPLEIMEGDGDQARGHDR
jgi:hypothetical protein